MNNNHPQLEALKALWNLPEEVLNKILYANTSKSNEEHELAVGLASQYIDFMDSVVDTENPHEAWEQWCIVNKVEHEISNNPY